MHCRLCSSLSPTLFNYKSFCFQLLSAALFVVHMEVYMRTLASVRAYTSMCTCVHCQVNDGKSAQKDWKICGKKLENAHLTRKNPAMIADLGR